MGNKFTLAEIARFTNEGNPKGYDVILDVDGETSVLGSFATPGSAFLYMADQKEEFRQQGVEVLIYVKAKE